MTEVLHAIIAAAPVLIQAGALVPLVDTIRASADLSSLATNVSALFDMFSRIIHAGLTDELAGFVTWLKQQLTVAMRLSLTIP